MIKRPANRGPFSFVVFTIGPLRPGPFHRIMNITLFQKVALRLLRRHFGLGITETMLWYAPAVESDIAAGLRPHQAVNQETDNEFCARIDVDAAKGIDTHTPLTLDDEAEIIAQYAKVIGSRCELACIRCTGTTAILPLSRSKRLHICQSPACGAEFVSMTNESLSEKVKADGLLSRLAG